MRHETNDFHCAVRMPTEHHRALRRLADAQGVSVSELVRQAVAILVETEPDAHPPTLDQLADTNPFIAQARRSR